MRTLKCKWIIILCFLVVTSASVYLGVFLYSARIPDHWQELSAGMTRFEVAEFLADRSTTVTRDSGGCDEFRIKRPIGDWLLLVQYNDDETFHLAHLRFSSPVLGEHSRERRYNERDAPYPVRSHR
jgi:hypothetical protein